MITGIHAIVYSKNAEEIRAFLADVLGLRSVDGGDDWPIFAAPPTELAVHPTSDEPEHEFYLMCDDVHKTIAQLAERGVRTEPLHERAWGLATSVSFPGGEQFGLYEPRHPSPLNDDRVRNVFALIDAMQSGKEPWSRFDDFVTADFTAFVPGQRLDREQFKAVMQSFASAFSDGSHTITDLICQGDTAMVREVWQGTHTGVFLGAQPTGKRVQSVVFVMIKFEGEKIKEFHETFDTLALMQDTGVMAREA